MKNVERQRSLDRKKWLESEKMCFDMSGKMPYCDYCGMQGFDCILNKYVLENICTTPHEEREQKCLCATAYNRMKRNG
jgi:hypothetical protein